MKKFSLFVLLAAVALISSSALKSSADDDKAKKTTQSPSNPTPALSNPKRTIVARASDAARHPLVKVTDPEILRQVQQQKQSGLPKNMGIWIRVVDNEPQAALKRLTIPHFRKMTWVSPQRQAQLLWLTDKKSPILHPDGPQLKFSRWQGSINEIVPTPRGWIAVVRITPEFGKIATSAYLLEKYELNNGSLKFLGAETPPQEKPVLILF